MSDWQNIILYVYLSIAVTGVLLGYKHVINKKNPFGYSYFYNIIGAFVWADTLLFGIFWTLFGVAVSFLDDWLLFLLGLSVFWSVRSFGEIIYWSNQQFSEKNINPVERFYLSKYFTGESIWFAFQVCWQCFLVISIILSIHFANLWLK